MTHMWLEKVTHALKTELRQIHYLAELGAMAPNEAAREMVMDLIGEELHEAMFWNHILSAYGDMATMPAPGPGMGVGQVPGILPPAGPGATLPPAFPVGPAGGGGPMPNIPWIFSEQEKEKDEK